MPMLIPSGDAEVIKKESRLAKNRQAAKECRKKKKAYVSQLEAKVGALEKRNSDMLNELEALKAL